MEHLYLGGLRAGPTRIPSSQNHLLSKGRGNNPENCISATTHCGPVPGKRQCPNPVGYPQSNGLGTICTVHLCFQFAWVPEEVRAVPGTLTV